jgi:hypothetical protein
LGGVVIGTSECNIGKLQTTCPRDWLATAMGICATRWQSKQLDEFVQRKTGIPDNGAQQ